MHGQQIFVTHPHARGARDEGLMRAIEQCYDCAESCSICADACLGEEHVLGLIKCARLCQDCADICLMTATVAGRRTHANARLTALVLETCAEACRLCKDECNEHAGRYEHCRICAEVCRTCETACRSAIPTLDMTLQ